MTIPQGDDGTRVPPAGMRRHPDRLRWNQRYEATAASFTPHPLVSDAAAAGLPDGPVLELACGRSGSALALAAAGRDVVAVDISDVALRQLHGEASRRGLAGRITCTLADVSTYRPDQNHYAMVLATYYWDAAAFDAACSAVCPEGLIAWEALSGPVDGAERRRHWYVEHGGLRARLPTGFTVLIEDVAASPRHGTTRLLARRR